MAAPCPEVLGTPAGVGAAPGELDVTPGFVAGAGLACVFAAELVGFGVTTCPGFTPAGHGTGHNAGATDCGLEVGTGDTGVAPPPGVPPDGLGCFLAIFRFMPTSTPSSFIS